VRAESYIEPVTYDLSDRVVAEIVIWRVPRPLKGSAHLFKYRLALIVDDICVLRYDNETGKGDHRHSGNREFAYDFRDPDQLQIDFWEEVYKWLKHHES
jgi:hypothetical protein